MAFHFQSHSAFMLFVKFITGRNMALISAEEQNQFDIGQPPAKAGSEDLRACRKLVRDDALEVQISLNMAAPLLKNFLREAKLKCVLDAGLFLRKALVRYLTLALYRLLDKPNQMGKTGITASIASLLQMAESEGVLTKEATKKLATEIDKIKADCAGGEYDMVKAIIALRDIQVAHSLIPWTDPADQLWSHHLVDFAEAVFKFVVRLDGALAEATGIALPDLRKAADDFDESAGDFWNRAKQLK
jgi:hypothetical protein